ncbi:MAG: hypothetical protein K2N18_06485, partial [Clostridia bacterium]|nr:hypothetical protein [Clostridia bacterium]
NLQCEVTGEKDFSKEKHTYEMGGIRVKVYNEQEGLVVAECDDKELQRLYSNGEEIPYALIGREEICSILADKNIKYLDGKIEIINNLFGNVGEIITLCSLKFEISSPMDYVRKTFKDKTGKFIGTYIELKENEEYSNDLFSNVSYPVRRNQCHS